MSEWLTNITSWASCYAKNYLHNLTRIDKSVRMSFNGAVNNSLWTVWVNTFSPYPHLLTSLSCQAETFKTFLLLFSHWIFYLFPMSVKKAKAFKTFFIIFPLLLFHFILKKETIEHWNVVTFVVLVSHFKPSKTPSFSLSPPIFHLIRNIQTGDKFVSGTRSFSRNYFTFLSNPKDTTLSLTSPPSRCKM